MIDLRAYGFVHHPVPRYPRFRMICGEVQRIRRRDAVLEHYAHDKWMQM